MLDPYNNQSSFGKTTAFWDGYYTGSTGDDWRGNGQHPSDAGADTSAQYDEGVAAGQQSKFYKDNG